MVPTIDVPSRLFRAVLFAVVAVTAGCATDGGPNGDDPVGENETKSNTWRVEAELDFETPPQYLTVGGDHSCAMSRGRRVDCWRGTDDMSDDFPERNVGTMGAGGDRFCLLDASGENGRFRRGKPGFLQCWGEGIDKQRDYCVRSFNEGERRCRGTGLMVGGDFHCAAGVRDPWDAGCRGLGSEAGVREGPADFDVPHVFRKQVASAAVRRPGPTTVRGGERHACARMLTDPSSTFGRSGASLSFQSALLYCWGANGYGQSEAPESEIGAFSVGGWHTCAIDEIGGVYCWGAGSDPGRRKGPRDWDQAAAPPGRYVDVAAGRGYTCAIREPEQHVVCWGRNDRGQTAPPERAFREIEAARLSTESPRRGWTCGVTTDDEIVCWGAHPDREPEDAADSQRSSSNDTDDADEFSPPDIRQLALGDAASCALLGDGTVDCWGARGFVGGYVPEGRFRSLYADDAVCGVRPSGATTCWGDPIRSAVLDDQRAEVWAPFSGPYREVVVDERAGCARRLDGRLHCWGDATVPDELSDRRFDRLLGDPERYCAIDMQGEVSCWGGEISMPDRNYADVGVGRHVVCGIGESEGTLACRPIGDRSSGEATDDPLPGLDALLDDVPEGAFRDVAVGTRHACAVREGGGVACWGLGTDRNSDEDEAAYDYDQASPPSGSFERIAAGSRHTCAVHERGRVVCWGLGSAGRTDEGGELYGSPGDVNQAWSRRNWVRSYRPSSTD